MKRKRHLKEIAIRLPVPAETSRSKEYDKLALSAANRLSGTAIKKVKFEGKTISTVATGIEHLVYSAWGTPKDQE